MSGGASARAGAGAGAVILPPGPCPICARACPPPTLGIDPIAPERALLTYDCPVCTTVYLPLASPLRAYKHAIPVVVNDTPIAVLALAVGNWP